MNQFDVRNGLLHGALQNEIFMDGPLCYTSNKGISKCAD